MSERLSLKFDTFLRLLRRIDKNMSELLDALRYSSGKLFEVSGYDDANIKLYLKDTLSETDGIVLYIDTAHTLTEPLVSDMLYSDIYKYDDILKLLAMNGPQPDLVILDNFYNIANKPKTSFAFFNIARIVSQRHYNLLFVNQDVYNFGPDKEKRKYIPQYDKLYRKYCSFRQVVYTKEAAKTTLNKIRFDYKIKTYGLSFG